MRFLVVLLAFLFALALPVHAQDEEEDGGFIANLLQSALSGENRSVQVIGLEGALSSRATIREIRISDDDGVWLTIREAELDWRRAALLRGRLEVNTLSASAIEIVRPPLPTEPDPELPSPVATPFKVPELPVAVNIGTLSIPQIVLGEPVLGIAAELALDGRLKLADGSLDTDLSVTRLDREGDRINLIAGFVNETRQITLDVDIEEAAGGLLAEVLRIPERPTVRLSVKGDGPVSDFTADIDLATAGEQRLGGQVRLSEADGGAAATRFDARLAGDLRPLMEPQFHAFFGTESRLDLSGQTGENGALDVESFALEAQALDIRGAMRIAEGGQMARVDLDGVIGSPEGQAIRLPLPEPVTEIDRAEIRAAFDADSGNGWSLNAVVDGFQRPDVAFRRLSLTGQGALEQGAITSLEGTLDAALSELTFADAALNAAVGPDLSLDGGFDWTSGGVIRFDGFELRGDDYTARLSGEVDGLDSGFALTGSAAVDARDLSRFSALAGRSLAGAVQMEVSGDATPLSGAFDIRLTMDAQDLGADIAQLDPLIAGQSSLRLDMARDENGTMLRAFDLESVALSASGNGTVRGAEADLRLNARLDDLARIVPQAPGPVTLDADITQSGDRVSGAVDLKAPDGTFADLQGSLWRDGRIEGDFRAAFNEVQKFVPSLSGSLTAEGNARRDDSALWQFSARAGGDTGLSGLFEGSFDETSGVSDLRFDAAFAALERFVPQLAGSLTASGRASRSDAARWQADLETGGTGGLSGQFKAEFDEVTGAADLRLDADLARLERFVPQLVGAISARGDASRSGDAVWQFDLETAGSAGISGAVEGRFEEMTGVARLDFDALFLRLERFVPQLKGAVAAKGSAERSAEQSWTGRIVTDGSAGIAGNFQGGFDETSGALSVFFDMVLAELERLVPGLSGTLEAKGRARRDEAQTWQANAVTQGDAGLSGTFKAVFEEASGDTALYFDATLERIQRIVSDISGTLTAAGQAERRGDVWSIDTIATGPGGISADVDGSYDQARNRADITAKGQLRLGLANPFLKPNSLRGAAQYDLALKGTPGVGALSGTVTSTDASMAIPSVAQTLSNLNISVSLADSRANVAVTGGLKAGGLFRVNGPVGLTAPFNGSLAIDLVDLILTDNLVFTSSANGRVTVEGPLAGGAQIAGRIDFGETEIDISSASGAVGAAPIPEIRHTNEPAASRQTRARAGLLQTSKGGGPAYGLDLTLNAPARIFARGRGLNAELGGNLTLRGTTSGVIPAGQVSLIRGVFDILGRRLTLDEGSVTLQGSLEPFLFFSASTTTSEGDATLVIAGPSSAPTIEVTSVPERPSEEALALLLFGNQFNDLSPLQIAQLGAQVAALAGRGGGFLGSVREGLGVDNIDITTDDDGRAQVGIGTYLAEGVYTDVIVNAEGESEVTLNLDLTDSLTAKGSVDNRGNTGIGLFFQRDY
jgi:translocation and assembly module TamB